MAKDVQYYPEDDSENKKMDSRPESDDGPGLDEGGAVTALIPKAMLKGYDCNPGDRIVMEVKHIYEDEVEVEFVKKLKGEGEDEMEEEEGEGESLAKEPTPEEQLESLAVEPKQT